MTWLKQTKEAPLYPDIDWDKPVRKDLAGRMVILGGNLHGFSAPARATQYAEEEGIGSHRVLLPDSLKKTLSSLWADVVFCPSTPSGSFSLESLDLILQNAMWADNVLLAGDFGRNSETAIVLERVVESLNIPVFITKDGLDYFLKRGDFLLARSNVHIVASFSQLQKLWQSAGKKTPLTFTMTLSALVEELGYATSIHNVSITTRFGEYFVTSYQGKVATTQVDLGESIWRLQLSTLSAVNIVHYPHEIFGALCHSVLSLK